MKIYCPFTNGDCNSKCIFNNNCGEPWEALNCNLADAVDTIRSLQAPGSYLDKRLAEVLSQTSSIDTNVSCVESDISSIRDNISNIERMMDKN